MDTAGFEQFYRAHHGRLATVLAATTGDLHVARDEDPLSRPIGWWLKEADTRIDGAFEAAFAGTGPDRRRWQLLSSLAAGPASRQDIAAALDGFDDSAGIQVVVDELVERGWVEQEHHRLRLTPAGAQRHAELATRVDGVRRRVAGALPQEEYAALVRLLARLVRGLDRRHPIAGAPRRHRPWQAADRGVPGAGAPEVPADAAPEIYV